MMIPKGSSSVTASQWMPWARQQLSQSLKAGTSQVSNNSPQAKSSLECYFDASRDQIPLQAPYPIVPSIALPPGHAFARRHADGTPLLVYRDKKDPSQIRAFVNSCSHRGSPLVAPNNRTGQFVTKPLKAPLLTCPYHSWTFDASSGALRKIPGHEKAFALMDTTELGLTPLTCTETAGYVWIGGDALRQERLWQAEDMQSTLEHFLHPPGKQQSAAALIGYREWTVQANWQLLVETALESYHVPALHQKTFHLVTDPTEGTMVSQWKDSHRNVTMTVPLRNFQPDHDESAAGWTDQDTLRFLGETTTTHLIFPAAFVTFFKRLATFITMEPAASQHHPTEPSTSTLVRAWALPHKWYEDDDQEAQKRDFASVLAAVEEDWECAEQIQLGLNHKDDKQFIFGGYEGNNVTFLNNVGAVAKKMEEMK
ncbi:rieske 2fe-2S domain-containing protein [Seminavis robusta]|uniref:Choline monooxygenase, chloroplastic n=1 Tax=Seminavis robusta TaxID=568900 RepID=A0A9N8ERR9_9STRA|nr:rieske 2fe-2S domain-containing protein [Seminavis robusta]|eukprot:Sro1695_g291750.1 rieske 2fe-2S domain-containing protein (426) ;mRNA; r:8188-9465